MAMPGDTSSAVSGKATAMTTIAATAFRARTIFSDESRTTGNRLAAGIAQIAVRSVRRNRTTGIGSASGSQKASEARRLSASFGQKKSFTALAVGLAASQINSKGIT